MYEVLTAAFMAVQVGGEGHEQTLRAVVEEAGYGLSLVHTGEECEVEASEWRALETVTRAATGFVRNGDYEWLRRAVRYADLFYQGDTKGELGSVYHVAQKPSPGFPGAPPF